MYFPKLNAPRQSRVTVNRFPGLDRRPRGQEGSFREMENLCAQGYPTLTVRRPRGIAGSVTAPGGLTAKDGLIWVDGHTLYVNGSAAGLVLSEGKKQLVSMGAWLLIWPDKKYLNTKNITDFGSMEASFESSGTVTYLLCNADGSALGKVSSTKPEEPQGGDYWIDTSQTPHSLMVWSDSSEMWTGVPTVYTKIQALGIGANFAQYDGVKISGVAYDGDSAVVKEQFDGLNATKVIYARDDDYIVVVGLIDLTYEQTNGTVTVERSEQCPTCKGNGCAEGTTPEVCSVCHGTGSVRTTQRTPFGMVQSQGPCPKCGGTGKIIHQPCPTCKGKANVRRNRKLSVNIPAGIDDGQTISMKGQGNAGRDGGPAGDLLVTVSVRRHETFERDGTSVLSSANVSFAQAALGADIEVPTLDGKVKLTIPEGTQPGTVFRLRGKGIPFLRGSGRGDQYVTVYIETPRNLNREQKEALKKFSESLGEKNYEEHKSFFGKFKL